MTWNSGPMRVNRHRAFFDTGTHWHRVNGGWFADEPSGLTDGGTVDVLDEQSDGGDQDVQGTEQR